MCSQTKLQNPPFASGNARKAKAKNDSIVPQKTGNFIFFHIAC